MKMYKNRKGASFEKFCKMGHFGPNFFVNLGL